MQVSFSRSHPEAFHIKTCLFIIAFPLNPVYFFLSYKLTCFNQSAQNGNKPIRPILQPRGQSWPMQTAHSHSRLNLTTSDCAVMDLMELPCCSLPDCACDYDGHCCCVTIHGPLERRVCTCSCGWRITAMTHSCN